MDGKRAFRLLLDMLVLSLTLRHNGASADDSCLATSECLNGGVLHCKACFSSNGNLVNLSCYCDCPSGYVGSSCETSICNVDGICDAPDDEFIVLEGGSPNLWRIDNFGNAVISHTALVNLTSYAMMRVGNMVYIGATDSEKTKAVYQIDWRDTSDPTAVALLVDITSSMSRFYEVGDLAYLRSIDKLLVFASGNGWLSVDPITGSYTKFYPTDDSVLNYQSYGALVVDEVLYWTQFTWIPKFLQLDVSDPLNLPAHTEVSPEFFKRSYILTDIIYNNGIIYILSLFSDVYAYDPSVGGTPQHVILGGLDDATFGLTWFNATHLLITKTSANEVSIVEIGTQSSPTPFSGYQNFSSVAKPGAILNLADYYTPA